MDDCTCNHHNLLGQMPFCTLTNYQLTEEFMTTKLYYSDLLNTHNITSTLERSLPSEIINTLSCQYYDNNEFETTVKKISQRLSVFHLNIGSSFKNYSRLKAEIDSLNFQFDIIALTEAGINNSDRAANIFDNYNFYYHSPVDNKKGGVAVYVRSEIDVSERDDLTLLGNNRLDNIWLEVSKSGASYIIGTIYRHPEYDTRNINELLSNNMSLIRREKKTCIICGDVNVDLLKTNNYQAKLYIDNIIELGLLPCITLPTRLTHHSATLIDHINLYRPLEYLKDDITCGNLLIDVSDHLPNFIILEGKSLVNTKCRPKIRIFSENNTKKFISELDCESWTDVTDCSDAEESMKKFIAKFSKVFNKCFPLKQISRKRIKDKKWVTKGIRVSIRHKSRLYKKYLARPTGQNKMAYKLYKSKLEKCIRKAQKLYFENLLQENQNSTRGIWKIYEILNNNKKKQCSVSKLLIGNSEVTSGKDIANAFNDYFVNIGPKLASKLANDGSYRKYLNNNFPNSMFLTPVIEEEVLAIINKLLPNKSPGIDNIGPKILKQSVNIILTPLTHVLNNSLLQAHVPSNLKMAKVIPIYKKKEKTAPGNYRPISLLSVLNKILEKLMHKRLYSFLMKYNILYKYQFGFRKGHSTILANIEIVDNIREHLDKGEHVLGIYLDLSKAFDTVNHEILLHKLNYYGIRGHALEWFKSYLQSRKQCVWINGAYSEPKIVTTGVPQGSVLGPLLFLIYVNDINCAINSGKLRLFADDSNLFITGHSLNDMVREAEDKLESLNKWFKHNQLTLNVDKTCYTLFSRSEQLSLSISLNGKEIEKVDAAKYLGIYLDSSLSWNMHVDELCKKVQKLFGPFYYISNYITLDMAKQLYYAFVHPHLLYGIEIYGCTSKSNSNRLQVLQNRILKTLTRTDQRASSTELLKKMQILNIEDIYSLTLLLFVYKQQHQKLPIIFNNTFTLNKAIRDRVTRQDNLLYVGRSQTNFGKNKVSNIAAGLWNTLPEEIRNAESVNTFKKKTVIYLLERKC